MSLDSPSTPRAAVIPPLRSLVLTDRVRVACAALPPLGAFAIQWVAWTHIRPFAWLMFYPAVFFSSWIGGLAGGLVAASLSAGLAAAFFMPPELSFTADASRLGLSIGMFIATGMLFGYFHGRLRRATQVAAEALESARQANERLDLRVRERTAELERINAALRESEELFSSAFRLSPDYVVIVRESDRTIVRANEAMGHLWGRPPQELVGRPTREFVEWLSEDERQAFLATLRERGECLNHETSLRMHDGRLVPCSLSTRALALNGERCFLNVMRDLTERRLAETATLTVAAIVESSQDAIIGKDLGGIVTSWNPGAVQIFGYSAAEMVGSPLRRIIPPERQSEEDLILARIAQGEVVRHFETVRQRKDGALVDISVTVSPIKDAKGRVVGASKIARDITERKRSEVALRRAKERFDGIAASSPGVLCSMRMAPGGPRTFDYAAPGIEAIFGVTAEELVRDAEVAFARIDPTDRAGIRNAIMEAVRTLEPLRYRFRVAHPQKGEIWIEGNSTTLREADGTTVWHGVMTDVTVQMRAEEARRASEEQFRTMFEVASVGMVQADTRTGRLLRVNRRMAAITGYSGEELLQVRFSEITHPDDRARDWEQFQRMVRGEISDYQMNKRYVRKDGTIAWVNVNATLVRDAAAGPVRSMAAIEDITARRHAEEEREKLVRLIEHSRDFIALADLEGRVSFMNAGARAMVGVPDGRDASTLRIEDYVTEEGKRVFHETILPAVRAQGVWTGDMQLRHVATAAIIDVQRSTFLIRDPAGQPLCLATVARDITREKQAAEKLAAERNLLRTLLDLLPDYVYVKDTECRFLACNDRCAFRFGLTASADLLGKTDADLFPPARAAEFRDEDMAVLRGTMVIDREESFLRPDGVMETILTTKVPLRDGAGKITGIVGCGRDITSRKRQEEAVALLNAELERRVAERTAELKETNRELEAFSYTVSHDLRAPLRAVDGFSLALMEDHGAQLPPDGQRQIQTIRAAAQRMGLLIDDLLAFSRLSRQPLVRQPVEMERLVHSVLADLAAEVKGRALELTVGTMPTPSGDPRLLRQVWINLIANALKYTRRRPVAVIEIGCREQGGEAVYFVRDNGTGFDMRYANKLFSVFQRLHRAEDYEGTGVGLAIVQRVVHRHGGRVWAEAEIDRGAIFFFTLGRETR